MTVDLDRGAGYGNTLTWAADDETHLSTQRVEIELDLNTDKFYRMFTDLMTAPTPAR